MKFKIFCIFILAPLCAFSVSADRLSDRKMPRGDFTQAEENFNLVMQKLLQKHYDAKLSKDELYRAATQGMLDSLNSANESWNKLLSPEEFQEMQVEFSGKVSGIGVTLKFDEQTGHAQVLEVLRNGAGEKAGLKINDIVLTVDGEKFKGKTFQDMVQAVRGETGKTVSLKVLREDKVIGFNITRSLVNWTPVNFEKFDENVALLNIGFFNQDTASRVESFLKQINQQQIKKLIVDLRNNSGGGFEEAVKTAGLFFPKDSPIVSVKNRAGEMETHKSSGGLLDDKVQIVVLVDKETSSGAELFAAALKDNKKSKLVGQATRGKWNMQKIETLPNRFAIKYTVAAFQSPSGASYSGTGIKPDVEVAMTKESNSNELRLKLGLAKRIEADPQLRAGLELLKSL